LPTFRNLLSVPSSKAGCRVLSITNITNQIGPMFKKKNPPPPWMRYKRVPARTIRLS
jgi:hypothetical protein